MIRLHPTFFSAVRMFSSAKSPIELCTAFLKPRRRPIGPDNPYLELSKGKACREPYIKGLVVAERFDNRLLTYPEVLDKTRLDSINELHDKVKRYVCSLNSKSLQAGLTKEIREQLKSLGAFGALVPKEFGGLGLTQTEFARFMEAFGGNMTLATIILAHNCSVAHLINRYGSDKLKCELLPKLASGEYVGAFAATEALSGSDHMACKCSARKLVGDDKVVINGEKVLVTNGHFADVFLTTCLVETYSSDIDTEPQLSIFVVEKNVPGVHRNNSRSLLGLNGAGFATVSFKNVSVPQDRILGRLGDGGKIGIEMHNPLRCAMAAAALGSVRTVFDKLLSDFLGNTLKPIARDQDLQEKLSELAANIYLMESMVYMTTAVEDMVEKPDILIEAWATGLTSLQTAVRSLETYVEIYGSEAFEKDHFASVAWRDLNCLLFYDTPQDLMRLFISMMSLQFAGAALNSKIQVLRDPLTNLKHFLKLLPKAYREEKDAVNRDGNFRHFMHPSMEVEANHVDYLHRFLTKVVRSLLAKFGGELFEYQIPVKRLSIAICELYGVMVAMSRLSRCKTKGLGDEALETFLFNVLLKRSTARIDEVLNDDLHFSASVSEVQMDIVEKLIGDGNYSFEHPLKKNF